MPTAAKLFGAIFLAALAWVVSDLIRPLMPEGTDFGWFNYANAACGLFCGWKVIGKNAGRGTSQAVSMGFTGVVCLYLLAIFVQSCNEMLRLALDSRFAGPVQAVKGILDIALNWSAIIATPSVLGTLAVGGIVIGLMVEAISRRWK